MTTGDGRLLRKAATHRVRYPSMMRSAVGILVLALSACAPTPAPMAPADGSPELRVMSYNLNYGLAGDEATMDAIALGDAEVVLLQETTPAWETALRRRFAQRYPHMTFHHCCGAGGLAVMSVHPITSEQRLEPSERDAWFPGLKVVVDAPLGPVQLVDVHLRPPVSHSGSILSGVLSTPPVRRQQIADFHAAFDPALPTIVAGDFNESSGGRAVGFLVDHGFRDALPEGGARNTWRWATSVGTIEQQLDHIMYGPTLQPTDMEVRPDGRSDHLPLVGTFTPRPPALLPAKADAKTSEPSSLSGRSSY